MANVAHTTHDKSISENNRTWKYLHNRGLNKHHNSAQLVLPQKTNRTALYTYITVNNQSATATTLLKLIFLTDAQYESNSPFGP
jgi:hypothetical protein